MKTEINEPKEFSSYEYAFDAPDLSEAASGVVDRYVRFDEGGAVRPLLYFTEVGYFVHPLEAVH